MDITDKQIKEAALNAAKEQGATIQWLFPYIDKASGEQLDVTLCARPKQAEQFLHVLSQIRIIQEVTLVRLLEGLESMEEHGAFHTPELNEICGRLRELIDASAEPMDYLNTSLQYLIAKK